MVQTGEEQDKEEEEKERGKIVVSYMPQYDQPCSDMTEALIALYSEFQHLCRELLNHNVVPSKTLHLPVHVVQRQLVCLTTICGISPARLIAKVLKYTVH